MGDVCQYLEMYWLVTTRGKCYCHLLGKGQGCCSTCYNSQVSPHKRESSSPKFHSAKVENPWTRYRRAHCSSWFWELGLSSLTGGCYRISDHLSQPGFSVTIPSSEKSQIQALILNVLFYDLIQCRKYFFLKVWSADVRCQSSCP